MAELWDKAGEMLGGLATKWTGYAAVGSFLLYLFGYLALRFQLSFYGVDTNIDAFDEKYLFAGCSFVVYLVSTVPSVLILAFVLMVILYLPYKLIPVGFRSRVKGWLLQWAANPLHMPVLGIVFAVLFIQFVERVCYVLTGNVLLAKSLPKIWIANVLLSNEGRLALFFAGLISGTMITGAVLFYALERQSVQSGLSRALVWLLGFLFAVEILLLPVNYGILISTQLLPRVAEISADKPLSNGSVSWLVWDSKDALTYLVRDPGDQRMLVTVPSKDVMIRIISYDNIICLLFSGNAPGDSHSPPEGTK
jgi:hypothetical protein